MAVYNRKDAYYKKAKREGYKSRAAYKLKELNDKYAVIKRGFRVLDCGAAPGGWSQAALEIIGDKGLVVGVDLQEITGISHNNFKSVRGDFTDEAVISEILDICPLYDAVISDIAPHTTGVRDIDHANSMELVGKVRDFADIALKKGGSLIFKLFEGEGRKALADSLKNDFKDVRLYRPNATRGGSMEIYVSALNKIHGTENAG